MSPPMAEDWWNSSVWRDEREQERDHQQSDSDPAFAALGGSVERAAGAVVVVTGVMMAAGAAESDGSPAGRGPA